VTSQCNLFNFEKLDHHAIIMLKNLSIMHAELGINKVEQEDNKDNFNCRATGVLFRQSQQAIGEINPTQIEQSFDSENDANTTASNKYTRDPS
jgi:hypothetical protein